MLDVVYATVYFADTIFEVGSMADLCHKKCDYICK